MLPRCFLVVALILVAWEGSGWAAQGCPAGQKVVVDLPRWAKKARNAATETELNRALAELGLSPIVATESNDTSSDEPRVVSKLHVDLFSARLHEGGEGRVVQVLAALDPDPSESWQEQRGAAFLPLGKDRWCRVAMPFLDRSGSDWGPQLCEPARFSFEPLVLADRVAIKLTEAEEWCGGSGSSRGGETKVSFWEVQGWKFVRLLSATTFSAYYHSPAPPIRVMTATLRLRGGFPKVVVWDEQVRCEDPGKDSRLIPEVEAEFAACQPSSTSRRCVYKGGVYTCAPPK